MTKTIDNSMKLKRLPLLLSFFCIMYGMQLYSTTANNNADSDSYPDIPLAGPLFSFGQDILPKGTFSPEWYVYYTDGPQHNQMEMDFRFLYGITNRWTFYLMAPFIRSSFGNVATMGVGDFVIGNEYALYHRPEKDALTQITGVLQIWLPTGKKAVARSTTTVFLGGTASTKTAKWYSFGSFGAIFSPPRNARKFSHIIVYQLGFGHTFFTHKDFFGHIMVEFDGAFHTSEPLRTAGPGELLPILPVHIPRFGSGNIIALGPTLLIGNDKFSIYIGFQYPIAQLALNPSQKTHFLSGFALDLYFDF